MEPSLQRILSIIPDALFEFVVNKEGEGQFIYLSEGITRLTGYQNQELTDLNSFINCIHLNDRSQFKEKLALQEESNPWYWKGRFRKKENPSYFVNLMIIAESCLIEPAQMQVYGIIRESSTTLISSEDEYGMKAQMIQTEKMASLGKLMAGIAHEINNPINFVYSNLTPLERDLKDLYDMIQQIISLKDTSNFQEAVKSILTDFEYPIIKEEINTLLEGLREGATRTREIVRGLRNFSRMEKEEFQFMNIHEGIDSTLILLSNSLKHHIQVNKTYGHIPMIKCQPGKLNQVFMNLLSNAIQAIEEEGEIHIFTENLNQYVKIMISDNGKGMDEWTLARIFEPFFTTKAQGIGTGLGLSITKEIIEEHQGSITVDSSEEKGTAFTIILPIFPKVKED